MAEEDDEPTTVFTPKKSNLSRQAQERNALRKNFAAAIPADQLPLRQTEDRPSYSADALSELKSSTPSTPKDLATKSDIDADQKRELDLASKFGSELAFRTDSAIPTDAEIQEKKQRRARLAKQQDFIGLDSEGEDESQEDSQESNDEHSLLPYARSKPSKKQETRLVRDDEDIAEGFEEFVEDGRIALGRKAEREQRRRHKVEMQAMIQEAEGKSGSEGSSEDDSERERRAAYEVAQTKAGMDGLKKEERGAQPRRPRTPPRITPLPTLAGCIEKLEAELAKKQHAKQVKLVRLEEVRKELTDIAERKIELQKLLDEAAENYRRLRADAGLSDLEATERLRLENGGVGTIDEMRTTKSLTASPGMGLGFGSRGLENL